MEKLPPGEFLLCIGNWEQVLTRQEYLVFIYAKDKKTKTDWKTRKGGSEACRAGLGDIVKSFAEKT